MDVAVVIPVHNQFAFTQACLRDLLADDVPAPAIAVVDNASVDETAASLAAYPGVKVIRNDQNRGCAGAWNQGARALPADWTVILNNDVLIPRGWLAGMLEFAKSEKIDVVSPAACEGETDYPVQEHGREFMQKLSSASRMGVALGFCFMVHRRVFERAGLFDEDPRLGGYEDDEFFRRARQAGFRLGMTGRSFLHHVGSVTQIAMKAARKQPAASLGDRDYYRKKFKLTWWRRQRWRWEEKTRLALWRRGELSRYGATLLATRRNGSFHWR